MIFPDHDASSETTILHSGVKGMHWGVKKKTSTPASPTHKAYSAEHQTKDKKFYGDKGVARINERMHAGQTHQQAAERELGRRIVKGVLLVVAAKVVLGAGANGAHAATRDSGRANLK